jgi:hypothetical protein
MKGNLSKLHGWDVQNPKDRMFSEKIALPSLTAQNARLFQLVYCSSIFRPERVSKLHGLQSSGIVLYHSNPVFELCRVRTDEEYGHEPDSRTVGQQNCDLVDSPRSQIVISSIRLTAPVLCPQRQHWAVWRNVPWSSLESIDTRYFSPSMSLALVLWHTMQGPKSL